MSYDVIIVGAGITAAAICAELKQVKRILVLDVRQHFGGNCHDYSSAGGFVHNYGPHLFHSTSENTTRFLEQYTDWLPRKHFVTAEFELDGCLLQAPFPFSRMTEAVTGELTQPQIINTFFAGYSEKMWGRPWNTLPASTRSRISMSFAEESDYFPGQYVAMPKFGFSSMIKQMFDGVELLLGVDRNCWYELAARHPKAKIVYTGRPDHIDLSKELGKTTINSQPLLKLGWRNLKIDFSLSASHFPTAIINYCHKRVGFTRKTNYGLLTGSADLQVISTETPTEVGDDDIPYYVDPSAENLANYDRLKSIITKCYPNLILAGRLGSYKYIDMAQAVAHGRRIATQLIANETAMADPI